MIQKSKPSFPNKTAMAVCVALAIFLVGCSSPPAEPVKVNAADPAGMGMTPQQQYDALQNNTSMPPALKARKMAMLKKELGMTTDAAVGKQTQK